MEIILKIHQVRGTILSVNRFVNEGEYCDDKLGEAGLEHGRSKLDINQRLELIRRVENGESYKSVSFSTGIQPDQISNSVSYLITLLL